MVFWVCCSKNVLVQHELKEHFDHSWMKDTKLDQCAFLAELELQLEEQEDREGTGRTKHTKMFWYMVLITSETAEFRPP